MWLKSQKASCWCVKNLPEITQEVSNNRNIFERHQNRETSRFYMPTKFHLIVFFFINLFGIVDVYIKIIFILLRHSTASCHGLFASRAAHRQKKKQYLLFFVSPQEFDWYEKFISCLIGCFYPWIWFDIKQFLYLIFGSR